MVKASPLRVVAPIFFSTHFFLLLVVTVALTVVINGVIDYFMYRNKPPWFVVDGLNTIATVMLFNVIVGILLFFSAKDIQKRVREGVSPPVDQRALRGGLGTRILFFSLCLPNWKTRLPMFLLNVCWFPGVPMLIAMGFFCWCAINFQPLGAQNCPATSIMEYVIWTELWKGISVGIVFAMNYAAAHNDDQPEVAVSLLDDPGSATGELR